MSVLLFECCRPIKGYCRSIIYDLQRTDYEFIPNDLFYLVSENEISNKTNNSEIEGYLNFLFENEYVTEISNSVLRSQFLSLNMEWVSPSLIENMSIKITDFKNVEIKKFLTLIDQLNCFYISISFCENMSLRDINEFLLFFQYSKVKGIELFVKYNNFSENEMKILCERVKRIRNIIIFSSPYNKLKNYGNDSFSNVVFTMLNYNELLSNKLNQYNFAVNYKLFTESQAHHTYFNRKLYIGPKGEIKNAPECEETFGNINDIKNTQELKQIIAKSEFQKYWYIHKELCDVCKDCEFRHMCVDSRLPFQREDDSWYHKTECNYNPYICKWEGEEGYQTLEECGVISDEKGFSIDHERIAAINKILWEEET